ncbi:MAG TPA: F0F1 ATP synthase subunit epsilon [Candidatus Acidoferrales bacterium]|jgi:F-type H+-transporting ATPase subunit epsilon|nr:F0F1 ATP synthase subunit epsilon [Candidatus Acidoferrales bacterium]
MADTFELEIATPERQLLREDVTEAQIPGKDGFLGILPGHAPLLGLLGFGALSYVAGGRRRFMAIHGGFLEVLSDHVKVLADLAERAEEIDLERAKRAFERGQAESINPSLGVDPADALAAMLRAQARVAAAEQK